MRTPAHSKPGRRRFLAAVGACATTRPVASSAQALTQAHGALTKEQRDRLTPAQVLDELKKGNERFRAGAMVSRDYRAQQRSSAAAQFPACVALGCVDSRVPAEVIFDVGIGDMFSARIAGNVVNDDLLGSLEFACAVAGAKVIVLFGHTACGAVKGAIDDVEMGNLTGLLARIKPAITAAKSSGKASSKDAAYVDAVARSNVLLGLDGIRRRSPILADLEKKGTILIVGGMYDLSTGTLEFLHEGVPQSAAR
jgi:carbonic anhydrase